MRIPDLLSLNGYSWALSEIFLELTESRAFRFLLSPKITILFCKRKGNYIVGARLT